MSNKRLYFVTEETTTTKKKGWVEFDTNFTQIFKCFGEIAFQINSPLAWKLLIWLITHEMNDNNIFFINPEVIRKFSEGVQSADPKRKNISRRTFQFAIDELLKVNAIYRESKGFYYVNPYLFWKDTNKKRTEFIIDGAKEKYYNPFKLDEEPSPYLLPE